MVVFDTNISIMIDIKIGIKIGEGISSTISTEIIKLLNRVVDTFDLHAK